MQEEEAYFEALENRFRSHLRNQSYLRLLCWVLGAVAISLVVLAVVGEALYLGLVYEGSAEQIADQTDWPIVFTLGDSVAASRVAYALVNASGGVALDAVEHGCSFCESKDCHGISGAGANPTDQGESTLDAIIMWAPNMSVGAVGNLKRISPAISVARMVMQLTQHSLLVGDDASDFAQRVGFVQHSLETPALNASYTAWLAANCTPNCWRNQSYSSCPVPPNQPPSATNATAAAFSTDQRAAAFGLHHETAGNGDDRRRRSVDAASTPLLTLLAQLVIDRKGHMACGASSNGRPFRIHGAVSGVAVPGAAVYCDNGVGGAIATGDYDALLRFLPALRAVMSMRSGMSVDAAANAALSEISSFNPQSTVSVVVVDKNGRFSAATINPNASAKFTFTVQSNDQNGEAQVFSTTP